MGKLYKGSSVHEIMYVHEIKATDDQQIVDLIYQVDERHPQNSAGHIFA